MPLFDAPRSTYPKRWKDYSFDFKIFFIWQISLFALIFFSGTISLKMIPTLFLECLLGVWLLALLSASVLNRRQKNWHWPGLETGDWFKAAFGVLLMLVFLYVFSQGLLPLKSVTLPMFLFAASIVVFNVLTSLRVVQHSESDFLQNCGGGTVLQPTSSVAVMPPSDPLWKRSVRGAYSIFFVLIWLEAMLFFYVHQKYVHDGSRTPTATQTESFNEHGVRIYVTRDQMKTDNSLSTIMAVGIPGAILSGLILQFVFGVRLFSNMPERRGWFDRDHEP
jgi:hypothetical protein